MPDGGTGIVWLLVRSSAPSAPVDPLENVCPQAGVEAAREIAMRAATEARNRGGCIVYSPMLSTWSAKMLACRTCLFELPERDFGKRKHAQRCAKMRKDIV